MAKKEKKQINKKDVIAVVVIIIAIILGIYFITSTKEINCKQDNDCKVALTRLEQNPCCWDCGYEAVSLDQYEKRQAFFEVYCKDVSATECPKCSEYRLNEIEAYCNEGLCALREKVLE